MDYIFAGNSPGQYFGNQDRMTKDFVNNQNVYWCDVVQGIKCYANGIAGTRGMTKQKISYLVAEISGAKDVKISPRSFFLSNTDHEKYIAEHEERVLRIKQYRKKKYYISLKDRVAVVITSLPFWIGIFLGGLPFLAQKAFEKIRRQ